MYLLFSGDHYYPSGGAYDFSGSSEDLKQLMLSCLGTEWANIFCTEKLRIVAYRNNQDAPWYLVNDDESEEKILHNSCKEITG